MAARNSTSSLDDAARTRTRLPRTCWTGRRVTVMGLGRHGGGIGAARYLAGQGAKVTISDAAERSTLDESLAQLEDVPIAAFKLGGHDPIDFQSAEFVVVNPAIRPEHDCLRHARERGARLTSEIELFLERCPARVFGVTGSVGKSTTCSMLARILTADGRKTWLGGNIGGSLLGELDQMSADDWVVLELSSFQLAHLSSFARMPEIAVAINCRPNHLDWHGSFETYTAAKQRLVREQAPNDLAILNQYDPEIAAWRGIAKGVCADAWQIEDVPSLKVAGQHNRQNAACAAAAAEAVGVDAGVIRQALQDFTGLEHRLQLITEIDGRRFYNDSKSTTPHATIAALAAVEGTVWLLAGGESKGASFDELASIVVARTKGAAFFGKARERLGSNIQSQSPGFCWTATKQLAEALDWCWQRTEAGDAILLSPACASYDQFRDFEHRGEKFRALVRKLAERLSR